MWKVVCRVDVRSKRLPLHFVVDDSHVLNIDRDADFCGQNREFRLNDVVPGNVRELKIMYILELALSIAGVQCPREGGGTKSEGTRNAESTDEEE
jgi:hypothetical protein